MYSKAVLPKSPFGPSITTFATVLIMVCHLVGSSISTKQKFSTSLGWMIRSRIFLHSPANSPLPSISNMPIFLPILRQAISNCLMIWRKNMDLPVPGLPMMNMCWKKSIRFIIITVPRSGLSKESLFWNSPVETARGIAGAFSSSMIALDLCLKLGVVVFLAHVVSMFIAKDFVFFGVGFFL